ncbi:MAG TPA: tRNA uridine-5-carboxymethylaminomethyl(34) synthesis GTPase MnmE [Syntrophomonas sp.]|jgi:tRNA modification GTPase|nr:tRNA uridine-5-carboxymethylaminomethyl(34) synthesis GTPase MnmE [Syntrophomonas sp.]
MFNDIIAALATPPGEGGVAIVRISGPGALQLVQESFKPYDPQVKLSEKKGFTLTLGWLMEKDEIIDEVLVGVMRTPKSYTGEDVVEINCHGGVLSARRCLEQIVGQGARLAEPGEFTRRAFLNGRIDLSQAEAVVDVIKARTEQGRKLALRQLQGSISRQVEFLQDLLIQINAQVEASIDFPDEVGDLDYEEVEQKLNQVLDLLDKILNAGNKGRIYQDGISLVICGKPNVGKSSLLNALVQKDKAIVTDIPGTTRDIVEEYLNVRGIPVRLMDTAGIRETEDVIEKIGVDKSRTAMENADMIIFLLDVASGITEEDLDIYQKIKDKKFVILVNKEDLEERKITSDEINKYFANAAIIHGSVRTDTGLEELEDAIESKVLQGQNGAGMEIMLNIRQAGALKRARKSVLDLLSSLRNAPLDCLGVDAWGALECLAEVTGKGLKEEVIDRIFKEFCIGK